LEIAAFQVDEIESLIVEVESELAALSEEYSRGGSIEKEEARRKAEAVVNRFDQRLKEILSPQWSHLKSILLGQYVREQGLFSAVLDTSISKELGLSADDQRSLKQAIVSLSDEANTELAKLRDRLVGELSTQLTDVQRKRLCDLAGVESPGELESTNPIMFYARLKRAAEADCCQPLLNPNLPMLEPVPEGKK
jgi:hypothetical protein